MVNLPQPKKAPDSKPKRKQQTKPQTEETETTGRPKRSVRKLQDNNNLSNSSENEKSRRTVRKFSEPVPVPVQEQSLNELEKVKRNLRKISLSATSEKPEIETEVKKTEIPPPEIEPVEEKTEDVNGSYVESVTVKEAEPVIIIENENNNNNNNKAVDDVENEEQRVSVEPYKLSNGNNEEGVNVEVNGNNSNGVKESQSQKTRRRKSLPAKQEFHESVSQNSPTLPSYMAATESAKAKLRAQAAAENGGGLFPPVGNRVCLHHVFRSWLYPMGNQGVKSTSHRYRLKMRK